MANENMQEYSTETATIDETVKVAKKFLEENPEVAERYLSQKKSIGIQAISAFLGTGWSYDRVLGSLQRLKGFESMELGYCLNINDYLKEEKSREIFNNTESVLRWINSKYFNDNQRREILKGIKIRSTNTKPKDNEK